MPPAVVSARPGTPANSTPSDTPPPRRTPSHEAEHRACLHVASAGHQRGTHGEVQRCRGRDPSAVADGGPEREPKAVQTREHRRAKRVAGAHVGHHAPIRYFPEWRVVGFIPAQDQVATEIREDERGAGRFGARAVTQRGGLPVGDRVPGALGRGWLGPRQEQGNTEQTEMSHLNLPLSGSRHCASFHAPPIRRRPLKQLSRRPIIKF